MNGRPATERLLRRSRVIAWATAAGASLATVGIVIGVSHNSVAATTSTTTSTSKNTGKSTSTGTTTTPASSGSTVEAPPAAQQQPVGGSHGS